MPKHSTQSASSSMSDPYLELCRRHPLRPLRDDADLEKSTAVIHALLDQDSLTPDEEDYLDVLSDLVQKYESEQFPTPPVSDAEMLRFLMDSQNLTQAQLARSAHIAESTISEVLSGRRTLTRDLIEALATVFHVHPAVFLRAAGRLAVPEAKKGTHTDCCST